MKNDKTDFTQGSILKKLALFMLPILGALVLQAAYGAVDLLVVAASAPPRACLPFPPAARCSTLSPLWSPSWPWVSQC